VRKLLPLIGTPSGSHPGGRSALTCRFRCGDACFHEVPNTSSNEYVGDVIAGALSRRSMMRAAVKRGLSLNRTGVIALVISFVIGWVIARWKFQSFRTTKHKQLGRRNVL